MTRHDRAIQSATHGQRFDGIFQELDEFRLIRDALELLGGINIAKHNSNYLDAIQLRFFAFHTSNGFVLFGIGLTRFLRADDSTSPRISFTFILSAMHTQIPALTITIKSSECLRDGKALFYFSGSSCS
ncbi:hypothetical protein AC578_4024 [Pseudocercospora eumusae]|uniref:Uncharacterized protein n=1 Tax=Pseudocercospora eumusae TaxID=321146 RepID=A0A139HDX7_9PEZI|nr:hypothetical protein AC578_4024 [Pseudocercospora eumusae]